MRLWRAVSSSGGQLEVGVGARDREEYAVVAAMTSKSTDLGQADTVGVKPDQLVEPLGVSGDAQLHAPSLPVAHGPRSLTARLGFRIYPPHHMDVLSRRPSLDRRPIDDHERGRKNG